MGITQHVMTHLEKVLARGVSEDSDLLMALKAYLYQFIDKLIFHHEPEVVLIIGINGAGKTSIGKLSNYYRKQGKW